MTATARKKKRSYWYKQHTEECVLCGKGSTVRERVYGRKPKDPRKRYSYRQYACYGHF